VRFECFVPSAAKNGGEVGAKLRIVTNDENSLTRHNDLPCETDWDHHTSA
jgi:hypothetical protein